MSTAKYKDVKFTPESLRRIEQCNEAIERYQEAGLRLTLRQLYYQLVTINAIPNEERSYRNLSRLVSDARLAGLVDWDAIEDRLRRPSVLSEWRTPYDLVQDAIAVYRRPRWDGQENYVELWVEKDALAGVLKPICNDTHITLMVNRGYSSISAMYESAQRYIDHEDKQTFLLYLGDHDPSGEDMVRDVADRLSIFGANPQVEKIALTMDQVRQYNPPPNPAKITDSRSPKYIAEHGHYSWEVDAIPPDALSIIVRNSIDELIDHDEMRRVIRQEAKDKARLLKAARKV